MKLLTSLLQNRKTFIEEIHASVNLKSKILALLLLSVICFGIYGFIIGLSQGFLQGAISIAKLPVLYILTLLICIPAFFIFSSIFGSTKSLWQGLALGLTATCIIGILLIGFAPVTLFILITTENYQFFKVLNVVFFAISGIVGARLFYKSIQTHLETDEPKGLSRIWFLRLWIVLYAFVGSQLGWTLRPFFGNPEQEFVAFQEVRGNFYSNMAKSLGHVLGNDEKKKKDQNRKGDKGID
ncbi:MAG: actin-binding WH2 domain-containing protein [Fimbriimonadaceae bacterium]|nr:actin-binding WH2 domain-containing protein [Chitinophagales bacterium]